MLIRRLQCEKLDVAVYESRAEMGAASAARFADRLNRVIREQGKAAVIFASAPSQNEFTAALREIPIDWTRVTAFHMDEYVGLPADHPASFRRYIREHLLDHVPIAAFHELRGEAADPAAECARYAALLAEAKPSVVAMGIGENGHLAFMDPPVCDFEDKLDVKVVELDNVCRMQQVHDGCFATFDDVPARALSLTVPVFMRAPHAVVTVPGPTKRTAVRAALHGPVTTACPASILRRHPDAGLFLDKDSAEWDPIEQAAQHLLAARRANRRGERIPEVCRPHDIETALKIQSRVAGLLDEVVGGWKASTPKPDKVMMAPIFAPVIHRGEQCPVTPRAGMATIEPEIAFVLAKDLPMGLSDERILDAIGEVRLVIEVIGSRYLKPEDATFPEMLADGLNNQALLVGPISARGIGDWMAGFPISIPGVFEGEGRHPDGHPLNPLKWLASKIPLHAGQIVTTGSYAGVIKAPLNQPLRIRFGDAGEIHATFTVR